jgi:hypothetical protein
LGEESYCFFTGIGNATGCQPSTIHLQVKVKASNNIKALDFIACFEKKCLKKCVKSCKNQNAEYINSKKSYYKEG